MEPQDSPESAAGDQPIARVGVSRLGLTLATGAAALIVFAPLVLVPSIPRWLIAISILVATVVASVRVDTNRFATFAPNALEWFLAAVGAVFAFVFCLVVGRVVVYGVAYLFSLALGAVLRSSTLDPTLLATVAWLIAAAVFAGIGGVVNAEMQLYPNEPYVRSPFFETAQRPGRLLVRAVIALIFFAVLFWLVSRIFGNSGTAKLVVIQLYLLVVSAAYFWVDASPTPSAAERAVERLLTSLDYTVISQPRTGNEAIEPLLRNLDLLAYNEDHAFAVQVESNPGQLGMYVAPLGIAAVAAEIYLQEIKHPDRRVEPLLVLESESGPPVQHLTVGDASRRITIWRMNRDLFQEINATEDLSKVRTFVLDKLGLRLYATEVPSDVSSFGMTDEGYT